MDKLIVVLIVIGGVAIIAALSALPLMLLWNWLMPGLFGLPVLSFWQALGLMFLASLIFGRGGSSSTSSEK